MEITIDKYDSKTGKGTLSYYARQYGTSVDALARSNNISNPNLIKEGAKLVVPDSTTRSTTSYRQQTQENMGKYEDRFASTSTQDKEDTVTKDNTHTATKEQYDPFAGLDDKTLTIQTEAQSKVKEVTAQYDSIQRFADRAHRELLRATKQIYGARLEKMEDANKRLLATKNTANIRQGRSRYTAELAEGILADEEISGNERLAEIEGEMLKAIAEADEAKATGDFERFNATYDRLDGIIENMNKQIQSNYDNAIAKDKAIRDEQKAERDAKKAEFDLMLNRASAAAPAIADKLSSYKSEDEQIAFLEAYSEQTGVDLDILMGEIETATQDKEYKDLQMANIKNQIYNRNRQENRLAAKAAKEEEDDDVGDTTKNVVAGVTTLDELSSSEREKVKTDLRDLGYYNDTPPAWFIEMTNTSAGQTVEPSVIKTQWEEHRQSIIDGGL